MTQHSYPRCIAIPSDHPGGLKAMVQLRFGRCPFFTIVKVNGSSIEEVEVVENIAAKLSGGAGPMAAQLLIQEQVNTVAGAQYGPNALASLKKGKIQAYGALIQRNSTVLDVVNGYLQGLIQPVENATEDPNSGKYLMSEP